MPLIRQVTLYYRCILTFKRPTRHQRQISIHSLITACILLLSVNAHCFAQEIQLITHVDNSVAEISKRELRAIFSMRMKSWQNQESIKVFVLSQNHPTHDQFCKDLLKVFPHQLQAGWDRLVFSGTGKAPKVLDTEAEMIKAIQSTPGSIGYILIHPKQKEKHSENSNEKLRTITLQ